MNSISSNQTAILYEITDLNKYLLNVRLDTSNSNEFGALKSTIHETNLFIILDNSGSMSGSPIQFAKNGITYLLENSSDLFDKKYLMTFNSETEFHELKPCLKYALEKITAQGGTDLRPVFKQITNLLHRLKNRVIILIFTDGCGTYTQMNIDDLKRLTTSLKFDCIIHTVGFSRDHDARLLSQLTQTGNLTGTFKYISEAYQIETAIQEILGYMKDHNTIAKVYVQNDCIGRVDLEKIKSEQFEGDLVLLNNLKDFNDTFKIEIGQNKFTLDVTKSNDVPYDKVLKCINLELIEYVRQISVEEKLSRQFVESIKKRCEKYKEIIQILKNNSLRLIDTFENSRNPRQDILITENLINDFYMKFLSNAYTSTIDNEAIAKFNALAYETIDKRSIKLKLDVRAMENVEKFEKIDDIIEKEIKKIDFKSLKLDDCNGQCIISCMDYIDLLMNKDCLCIALDIERPEAAIMDPTRVIIKNIHSTMISAESFFSSVQFALTKSNNPVDCHGGFGKSYDAKILKGQSRENITGILPLYINSAHWSIARQKMKSIMGWMCTLNILGYNYQQVTTVPFNILAKSLIDLHKSTSEFKKTACKMILDVCIAIYRESSATMRDELFDSYGNLKYIKHACERTIDCVPNHLTYLAKVLCTLKNGDIIMKRHCYENLVNYVLEEQHRRMQTFIFAVDSDGGIFQMDKVLYELLGVIQEEDIDCKVKIVENAANELIEKARKIIGKYKGDHFYTYLDGEDLKDLNEINTNDMNNLVDLIDSMQSSNGPRLDNKFANKLLLKFDDVSLTSMHDLCVLLASFKAKNLDDLKNMELNTVIEHLRDYQKLAILVQNMHGVKNADRRYYIDKQLYIDPFDEPSKLLEREYHRIVNNEIKKACNLHRSRCINYLSEILKSNRLYYMFSDAVAIAYGEFCRSIQNFNTDDDY